MPKFTDSKGDAWGVSITFGTLKRLKAELDVALTEISRVDRPDDVPALTRLVLDIELLVNALCVVCRQRIDSESLGEEDFAELLSGNALAQAQAAFWEALSDFFRSLGRTDIARAIEKQAELVAATVERSAHHLDEIDVADAIDRAYSNLDTSSPASPASTPRATRSASSSGSPKGGNARRGRGRRP